MAISNHVEYDVTVVGEVFLDHVLSGFAAWPLPGEEIFTDRYAFDLGGGAINTACALARLGRSVQLIGVVGAGELATVQERLADFGVSSDSLIRSAGRTGTTVSVSTAAERTFYTFRGVNSELQPILASNPQLLARAARARFVHLALPLELDLSATLLHALRQHDASIALDVGHQVDWLTSPRAPGVLRSVDYFLPNEKEAALFAGDAAQYLARCGALGLKRAVVKLGAAGAAMLADGEEYYSAAPAVDVLDTTGAGDAFNAGLLDELLSGGSPQSCLQHACACGTLSTTAAGGLAALPTRKQARALREKSYVA